MEMKRRAEPRRVVVPGGEIRAGGAGPAIERRKVKPVEKPERRVPGEGFKPGGNGPGGAVRKTPGHEGKGGPVRKEGPSGKSN